MKLTKRTTLLFLALITIITLGLRIYKLGVNNFVEEENSTIKSAAYLYYCRLDKANCQVVSDISFKSKFWALMLNNETLPNLFTKIYQWDFVSQKPTLIHQARAWPQLLSLSWVYQVLGISEWSSRLISVLAGTLLIPAGWLLAKYLNLPNDLSLIYVFSLALSPSLIEMSRNSRMYSLFILVFLLLINQKLWKKPILGIILLLLTYWLHLLTLILPIALLIYSFYWGVIKHQIKQKWLLGLLLGCLLIFLGLQSKLNLDVFFHYFWSFRQQPNWQYLEAVFNFPLPWFVSLLILVLSFKKILALKKLSWLLTILLTYLGFLIFWSQRPTAGAYVVQLLPITIYLTIFCIDYLTKTRFKLKPIIWSLWIVIILVKWVTGINYLYFGKNGQAKIPQAYQIIINKIKPGEQILGIQIRDYYLQGLPPETIIIDLEKNPQPEFNGSCFVVWEKEKITHLDSKLIDQIKQNFIHLAGEGIDQNGVEIYRLGK